MDFCSKPAMRLAVLKNEEVFYSHSNFDRKKMRKKTGYIRNLWHGNDTVLLVWNVDTAPSSFGNVNLMAGDPDVISRAISEHTTHLNNVTRILQEKLTETNVAGRVLQLHGHNSGDAIIKAATKEGADMIVVGSRGIGTIRRKFLGLCQ